MSQVNINDVAIFLVGEVAIRFHELVSVLVDEFNPTRLASTKCTGLVKSS